jgi:hypothetical protein
MSRREDFARLVDGDVAVRDSAVSGLADIAAALRLMGRTVTRPEPGPQFRTDLRQRLVAVATVQAAGQAAGQAVAGAVPPSRVAGRRTPATVGRTIPRGRRTILALASTVAVATSVTGVAVAASGSLPGSPFYDVKRATESVQLWTAQGQLAKGHRHLEFAATRLSEAQQLSPTSSHLPSTLDSMDEQTRDGTNDLVAVAQSSQSTAPLVELQQFAHRQYAGIQQLLASAAPALRQREIKSATLVELINAQAATLRADCVSCTGPGSTSGGLGGLLQGGLPTPGGGGAGPGGGSITARHRQHHGHGVKPVPTPSGVVPKPKPSLPIKLPTTLPSVIPTLPSTLKSLLPSLPTKLPSSLPSVLPPLPTLLPTSLPTIKL